VLELDLYWAVHGGQDPVAIIERYPGRVHAWHVKDRTAAGQMVDVGDGVIDFAAIFAWHARAGLRHAFVEHDRPSDPLGSAARSFEALSGFRL
jgi:sugar phosphate isomerase/epimerase